MLRAADCVVSIHDDTDRNESSPKFYRKIYINGASYEDVHYLVPNELLKENGSYMPLPDIYKSYDYQKALESCLSIDYYEWLSQDLEGYIIQNRRKKRWCATAFISSLIHTWGLAIEETSEFKSKLIKISKKVYQKSPERFKAALFLECVKIAPGLFGIHDHPLRTSKAFRGVAQFEMLKLCHVIRLTHGIYPFVNYNFSLKAIETIEASCERWREYEYRTSLSHCSLVCHHPYFTVSRCTLMGFPLQENKEINR